MALVAGLFTTVKRVCGPVRESGNTGFFDFYCGVFSEKGVAGTGYDETRMTYLDRLTKGVDGRPIFEPSSNFYGHS